MEKKKMNLYIIAGCNGAGSQRLVHSSVVLTTRQ